jgi:hypothetical protein
MQPILASKRGARLGAEAETIFSAAGPQQEQSLLHVCVHFVLHGFPRGGCMRSSRRGLRLMVLPKALLPVLLFCIHASGDCTGQQQIQQHQVEGCYV